MSRKNRKARRWSRQSRTSMLPAETLASARDMQDILTGHDSTPVTRAFSPDALSRICTMPEQSFAGAYGMQTTPVEQHSTFRWEQDFYHFKDNGSSVLAVAHLDTVVHPEQRAASFAVTPAGPVVRSGALDDRLGAYIILDLLPQLGITYDWLLTTGEEKGMSTAAFFKPPKAYDWMIEFDRGGTDVVMYQYDDLDARQAVRASGAVTGNGIFSDICYLEHLGVKGFNWGVAYRDYHGTRSHAYLSETFAMVTRYLTFHTLHAGTAMPYVPSPRPAGIMRYSGLSSTSAQPPVLETGLACDFCGSGTVDEATLYCRSCRSCQDCGEIEEDCLCYLPRAVREDLAALRAADRTLAETLPFFSE